MIKFTAWLLLVTPLTAQQFSGRLDLDFSAFSSDDDVMAVDGPFENGGEMRRARIGVSGKANDWLKYKASLSLTASNATLKDLYVTADDFDFVDTIKIGHLKEPFGLERQSSSLALPFLERSIASTLAPSRNIGILFSDKLLSKNATYSIGLFRESDSSGESQDSVFGTETGLTGRVTFTPLYADEGSRVLHLGMSASLRNPDDGEVRFDSGTELAMSPDLIDTQSIPTDSINLIGLELGMVHDNFSLRSEYIATSVKDFDGIHLHFPGFYIQSSYFLSGEHDKYSRSSGKFKGIEPNSEFTPKQGKGALELSTRFSSLDLDSKYVLGGHLRGITLGLGWHLNETTKLQLNYNYSELEYMGNVQGVALRFHFHW